MAAFFMQESAHVHLAPRHGIRRYWPDGPAHESSSAGCRLPPESMESHAGQVRLADCPGCLVCGEPRGAVHRCQYHHALPGQYRGGARGGVRSRRHSRGCAARAVAGGFFQPGTGRHPRDGRRTAGGREEDIERARPILAHLGQRLTRMGDVGAGQVTKVCNQMIVACNALVLAEVVALAEQSGVDASLLADALAGFFATTKPLQIPAPQMAASQFEPVKWHVRPLLKDLDTAVKLSREVGAATPLSGLAAQLMRLHGSQGHLEHDPATLVQLYRQPEV